EIKLHWKEELFLRVRYKAVLGQSQPGGGQVFQVLDGVPNIVVTRNEVAICRFLVFFGILTKLARLQSVSGSCNTDERASAGPAEDIWIDRLLFFVILFVDTGFQGDEALVVLIERGVD